MTTHAFDVVIQSAVIDADQSNTMHVAVDLADAPASFWSAIAGAGEIRVFQSDGTTECPAYVEGFATGSPGTGVLFFFPNGQTISASADTTFQVHIDASRSVPAVTDTYGRNNVFQPWHYFLTCLGGSTTDVTGNGLSGSVTGTISTGSAPGGFGVGAATFATSSFVSIDAYTAWGGGADDTHTIFGFFKVESGATADRGLFEQSFSSRMRADAFGGAYRIQGRVRNNSEIVVPSVSFAANTWFFAGQYYDDVADIAALFGENQKVTQSASLAFNTSGMEAGGGYLDSNNALDMAYFGGYTGVLSDATLKALRANILDTANFYSIVDQIVSGGFNPALGVRFNHLL